MNRILLELAELRDGTSSRSLAEDVESLELCRDEYVFHSPVRIDLEVTKSEQEINVTGEVSLPAQVECARCASTFAQQIRTSFKSRYIRIKGGPRAEPQSADEGVFQVRYDESTLDLTDEIREAVLVSLPIRALCDAECKGLCPVCGANLNEGDCSCERRQRHPAWGALEKLRGDTGKTEKP